MHNNVSGTLKGFVVWLLWAVGLTFLLFVSFCLLMSIALFLGRYISFIPTEVFVVVAYLVAMAPIGYWLKQKLKASHIYLKWSMLATYMVLCLFFAVTMASTIFIGVRFFTPQHKIFKNVEDCESYNLSEVKSCSGSGKFGFQNNYHYDISASGVASFATCQAFDGANFSQSLMSQTLSAEGLATAFKLHSGKGHKCHLDQAEKSWNRIPCIFKNKEISNCYYCASGLSNGNGHRVKFIGFSENCQKGAYRHLAGWHESLMEKALKITQ